MWSQLQYHAWHLDIYSNQPSKVVNVICDVCDQKITVGNWKNVAHIIKEEKTFCEMNHILDSKIEPLIFHLSGGGLTDDSDNELVSEKERWLQCNKTSIKEKHSFYLGQNC